MDEAWRMIQRAETADPANWFIVLGSAMISALDGDFEAATAKAGRSSELIGGEALVRMWHGLFSAFAGQEEKAVQLLGLGAQAEEAVVASVSAVLAASVRHDREAVRRVMEAGLLERLVPTDHIFSWFLADCFARLGEPTEALRWLEYSIRQGLVNHRFWSEIDPWLVPLRGDPRFAALMQETLARQRSLGG
jgi:hypothetical protein